MSMKQTLWFNRDRLQELVVSSVAIQAIKWREETLHADLKTVDVVRWNALVTHLSTISERAGYRVVRFLDILEDEMGSS